jgi:CheY-like chemotaxis protein
VVTAPARTQRVLLRAEVVHPGGRILTHTLEIAPKSITFACGERLAAGTKLRVLLSFPRLVDEFEIEARVISSALDDGHGRPACVEAEITSEGGRAREILDGLLALTSDGAVAVAQRLSYRCLLVEDNDFIRDLFAYGMEKYRRTRSADVSLALATDGREAWDMLRQEDYDLAIVDYYLPIQNGSELIARMRAEPRLAGMPIVAISVGGVEAREASVAAGADLFLDKPIVMRDLWSTLDKLTRGPEGG